LSYLLDTHVLLWFRIQPDSLGPQTLKLLSQRKNELSISVISALEIAQLTFKNRITLPQAPDAWFEESLRHFNTRAHPLTPEIAAEAYRIPEPFHPDPADRILVASARLGNHTLITADRRILDYPKVRTLDARK
jgi:PIN domain nuclease of toxin-antitoxin system